MTIFTAEIARRPTIVFAALDQAHARAFVGDSFIRLELCRLRNPDGVPLWDGQADVTVRRADPDEQAI